MYIPEKWYKNWWKKHLLLRWWDSWKLWLNWDNLYIKDWKIFDTFLNWINVLTYWINKYLLPQTYYIANWIWTSTDNSSIYIKSIVKPNNFLTLYYTWNWLDIFNKNFKNKYWIIPEYLWLVFYSSWTNAEEINKAIKSYMLNSSNLKNIVQWNTTEFDSNWYHIYVWRFQKNFYKDNWRKIYNWIFYKYITKACNSFDTNKIENLYWSIYKYDWTKTCWNAKEYYEEKIPVSEDCNNWNIKYSIITWYYTWYWVNNYEFNCWYKNQKLSDINWWFDNKMISNIYKINIPLKKWISVVSVYSLAQFLNADNDEINIFPSNVWEWYDLWYWILIYDNDKTEINNRKWIVLIKSFFWKIVDWLNKYIVDNVNNVSDLYKVFTKDYSS